MSILLGDAEIAKLIPDNCNQAITPQALRDALHASLVNSVSSVSPVYVKEFISQPDEMNDPDLLDHSLQITLEDKGKELKVYDEALALWVDVFTEQEIKRWIAAGALFDGVVAENSHTQGTAVKKLSDIVGMFGAYTAVQMLDKASHYFTWNGADGYIITDTDINGMLDGHIMQTGDWIQLVNLGGTVTDPNHPDYATQKPVFDLVHISGDNLSKSRADGLYSFDEWVDGSYEDGSLVTHKGRVFRATATIALGDIEPHHPMAKWYEVDLSGVTSGQMYLGKGRFDSTLTTFDQANNWGMPVSTYPQGRKPHDGDAFLDIETNSTVIFMVDADTEIVTVMHEYGHTREFEYLLGSGAVKDHPYKLLTHIDTSVTGMYTITFEDLASGGSTAKFMLLISEGYHNFLLPIVVNPHNTFIHKIGYSVSAGVGELVIFPKETTTIDHSYKITVHSDNEDLSVINVGTLLANSHTSLQYGEIMLEHRFPHKDWMFEIDKAILTNAHVGDTVYQHNVANTKLSSIGVMNENNDLVELARNRILSVNELHGVPDYIGQVAYIQDSDSTVLPSAVALDMDRFNYTSLGGSKIGTSGGKHARGILIMTEAQYNALPTKDQHTLYFIEE